MANTFQKQWQKLRKKWLNNFLFHSNSMKRLFALILVLGFSIKLLTAQFIYENRVYSPLIRTVILEQTGKILSDPVLYLGSEKKLALSFDELSEETRRFEYTIIHCEADWTESNLDQTQYLEGFEVQKIEGFANSFNTIQRYVHYSQNIPSNDLRITKSGNYILKVFEEGNEEKVILTRRFYVVDDKSNIALDIHSPNDVSLLRTHQEINVKVEGKNGFFFQNPEAFMKVVCMQNGREDLKHLLQLRGSSGAALDYSFDQSNLFPAGNEFRRFDFTSLKLRTQYIRKFDFFNGENQVFLLDEKVKKGLAYSSEKDINGDFYIRNEYKEDNAIGSDYAWVHFTLPMQLSLEHSYYVVGSMTDWRMSEQNKMKYEDNAYRLSLYLKQGVYNYLILSSDCSESEATSIIEGNHTECNNKYKVFVYYKNFSDNYDELVGFSVVEN